MNRALALFALTAGCFSKPPFDPQLVDAASDAQNMDAVVDAPELIANVAFATSITTTIDTLGSLNAADTFCQQRAMSAGLPPNTYRAWLSTASTPAVTRLGTARGWVRVDGRPFADQISQLLTGEIYHPLRLDELGVDRNGVTVATGTAELGTADGRDCSDLVGGTTEQILSGVTDATRKKWTDNAASAQCASAVRLYCLGIDRQAPVSPPLRAGRIAFLSESLFGASIDGTAKAEAICADEAMSAGFTGAFHPLLASTQVTAASRFTDGERWVRVDGIPLAATAADLLNGSVLTSLNVTSMGRYVSDEQAWTGIENGGTLKQFGVSTCGDWTDTMASGGVGNVVRTTHLWFRSNQPVTCDTPRRIYCLQE